MKLPAHKLSYVAPKWTSGGNKNSSNGDNQRFLRTKKETEIAYDFGKILTVNGYGRGEKLVNSIPFYVYLINYRQMAGGEKS